MLFASRDIAPSSCGLAMVLSGISSGSSPYAVGVAVAAMAGSASAQNTTGNAAIDARATELTTNLKAEIATSTQQH